MPSYDPEKVELSIRGEVLRWIKEVFYDEHHHYDDVDREYYLDGAGDA